MSDKSNIILDVSYHNGDIKFKELKKQGYKNVIIRAGYGNNNIDKLFKQNIKRAIKNKFNIGIYWFSYAQNVKSMLVECESMLKILKPYKKYINLPVFYDFEYDSDKYNKIKYNGLVIKKSTLTKMCRLFCKEVKNNGYKAGVYLNEEYATRIVINNILRNNNYIWYARYIDSLSNFHLSVIDLWQNKSDLYIKIGDKNIKFDNNIIITNRLKKLVTK